MGAKETHTPAIGLGNAIRRGDATAYNAAGCSVARGGDPGAVSASITAHPEGSPYLNAGPCSFG